MDYSSVASAGIAAAGNTGGTLMSSNLNAHNARKNLRYGYELMNKQMQLTPSYEMMGYRNAGINPFVEGASDFQGGTPTVPDTPQVSFGSLGTDTMAAFQQARLASSQINLQDSETTKNYVSSEEGRANIALIRANTDCSKQQATNLALEYYHIQADIDVAIEQRDKLFTDSLLNYANIENTQVDTENKREEISVTKLRAKYQDLMNQSLDKYINITLPKTWKKLDADIDVAETQKALNAVNYEQLANQVILSDMSVMEASKALADNIEAAGYNAKRRLFQAYLGFKEAEIDKSLNDKYGVLRLATRMIGMISNDMKTDVVAAAKGAISAIGDTAGAIATVASKL